MTDMLATPDTASDAELMSAVRAGDSASFGELFSRHIDAARKMARYSASSQADADDLVAEAFSKVFTQLRRGVGPDIAFRAYLLTTIRRLHVDKQRVVARVQPTDDLATLDRGVDFRDSALADFESGTAAAAFASLPERWQLVLWHLDVEGQKPAAVALLLGMSANSVSALAYRAREGLRQAYLQNHLKDTADGSCRWTTEHLGAYVRNGLARRDQDKVRTHLDECRRCTGVYLELADINSNLRALLGPALLGAAAAGYLGTGGKLGFLVVPWGRIKEWTAASATNAGIAVAGVVTAAAAATALIYVVSSNGDPGTVTSTERSSDGGSGSVSEQPAQPPRTTERPGGSGTGPNVPDSPGQPDQPSAVVPPILAGPGPTNGASPTSPGASPTSPTEADSDSGDGDGDGDGSDGSGPPASPTQLSASVDGYEVTLDWKSATGPGVRYEIYRDDAAGEAPDTRARQGAAAAAGDPVATTTRTRYVDEPEGGEYEYTVVTVRRGERSKVSRPVSAKVPDAIGPITNKLTDGDIRCLTATQALVTVEDGCTTSAPQWSLHADGTIRTDGQCLAVGAARGTFFEAQVTDCDKGSLAQQWDIVPFDGGRLVKSRSEKDKVLDVEGRTGTNVIVYPEHRGDNQTWALPARPAGEPN